MNSKSQLINLRCIRTMLIAKPVVWITSLYLQTLHDFICMYRRHTFGRKIPILSPRKRWWSVSQNGKWQIKHQHCTYHLCMCAKTRRYFAQRQDCPVAAIRIAVLTFAVYWDFNEIMETRTYIKRWPAETVSYICKSRSHQISFELLN